MNNLIWKVFVPCDLLTVENDSYMFGHVIPDNQSVYITASSPDVSLAGQPPAGLELIGCWKYLSSKLPSPSPHHSGEVSVSLASNLSSELRCNVYVKRKQQHCTCIVYNPLELLKSSVLSEECEVAEGPYDTITTVVKVLSQAQQDLSSYEVSKNLQTYCGCLKKSQTLGETLVSWLLLAITWLYKPVMVLGISQRSKKRYIGTPTVLSQLVTRAVHLNAAADFQSQSPLTRLKSINKCVNQVVDSLLGICLMLYLINGNQSQYLADVSLSYGDTVAGELRTLLHWLMGAPAGLKLNSQLTHLLANFFQYHIYLWTGYLNVLKPMLGQLVLYSSVTGVLGLTVQLALFQDICTTLTLHIYCFYVYAARLYRLQVYALSSLWRLFRGKKWNVLRERVDSARYDAGQLFVGTLLFTILLFLLPTTGLYYVVFTLRVDSARYDAGQLFVRTMLFTILLFLLPTIGLYYVVFTLLRLVILSIQGVVTKVRALINKLPVWTLWLWLIQSPSLTDAAVFNVLVTNPDKGASLLVSLQCRRLGLCEAVSLTSHKAVKETTLSWAAFVSSLLQGHLIYPWIDRK